MRGRWQRFSAADAVEHLSHLWDWWRRGIVASLPPSFWRLWSRDPHELSVLLSEPPQIIGNNGQAAIPATHLSMRSWVGRRAALTSVRILVPADACLTREIEFPAAGLRRIGEALALDMESTTPFGRADVYSGWVPAPAAHGCVTVNHIILKRSAVDNLVNEIKASGLPICAIEVIGLHGATQPLNLLPQGSRQRALFHRWVGKAALATTIAALGLLSAAIAAELMQRRNRLHDVEAELKVATAASQAVRRRIAQVDAASEQMRQVRLRKLESVPLIGIWEELTRVLPSTTWISELRFDGSQGQIDGLSQNAPELVAILSRSSFLSNVAFASPVTRDPQRSAERFQIKFEIQSPLGKRAARPERRGQ